MFLEFINKIKIALQTSRTLSEKLTNITNIDGFYQTVLGCLFLTVIINYCFFYLFKNINKLSTNPPQKKPIKFSPIELVSAFLFYLFITIISYIKIITEISNKLFSIGGDSFNHYARLVESKKILSDPEMSIFHWPGIFFPDGLTAFDGAPTLVNDIIHYVLSPFFNSVFIYNLIHLSTFPLAGLFTYILVKEMTNKKDLAIFSGLLFAFSHQHLLASHLWLNITHIELMPFIFWLFIKIEKPTIKNIFFASSALTVLGYQSLYFLFFMYLLIVLFFILPRLKNGFQHVLLNAIPLFSSGILMLFWLVPMLNDPTMEKGKYVPHIFFNADIYNILIGTNFLLNDFATNPQFIGLPLVLLAIISVIKKLNTKIVNASFLTLFIFSLGSVLKIKNGLFPVILPEILLTILPAFKSLRSTDRFIMLLIIPISIMAYNTICHYTKKRTGLTFFILFALFTTQFKFNNKTIDVNPPEIYQYIPEKPSADFGVLEFPLNNPKYWMWRASHQYQIVYGYLFIRGKKDKFFHQLHKNIIKREKINIEQLKDKKVKYIISHIGDKENLYANIFGDKNRKNEVYLNINQYIDEKGLDQLVEIKRINNKALYQIID